MKKILHRMNDAAVLEELLAVRGFDGFECDLVHGSDGRPMIAHSPDELGASVDAFFGRILKLARSRAGAPMHVFVNIKSYGLVQIFCKLRSEYTASYLRLFCFDVPGPELPKYLNQLSVGSTRAVFGRFSAYEEQCGRLDQLGGVLVDLFGEEKGAEQLIAQAKQRAGTLPIALIGQGCHGVPERTVQLRPLLDDEDYLIGKVGDFIL